MWQLKHDTIILDGMSKFAKWTVRLLLISICLYGAGRLYFALTAGFTVGNVTDLPDIQPFTLKKPSEEKLKEVSALLDQPFHYLGKGCQSYVFESADGKYVLKFLKLQRFRPQWYLSYLPGMKEYRQRKALEKKQKLLPLLSSWKIAYEDLAEETGVIYFHLPGVGKWDRQLTVIDKTEWRHNIDPDQTAFLLQRKASMLCPTLVEKMKHGDLDGAKELLNHLVTSLIYEYKRGFGDNDHALMQNTGVLDGRPVHIDVGQLSNEERFKDSLVYKEELFSKTYKFRIWLSKRYPELERHLYTLLYNEIGPEISQMKAKLKTVDEGA